MQTIYFDGECPICIKEIAFYRKHANVEANWVDASKLPAGSVVDGESRYDLLTIMHVRDSDGRWLIAVDAFAAMWRLIPFLRPFAWIFTVPGLKSVWMAAYKLFLKYRNRNVCDEGSCSI